MGACLKLQYCKVPQNHSVKFYAILKTDSFISLQCIPGPKITEKHNFTCH